MAVDTTRGRSLPAAGGPGDGGSADHARLLSNRLGGYRLWRLVRRIHRDARSSISRSVDRWLAVDTTPDEPDAKEGVPDNPSLLAHRPTGWLTLWRIFRRLRVSDNDVLLDVGSGAGRALLVASLFPFRRVIGLEKSETLARLSQQNLKRSRMRRHASVTLIHGDAAAYEIPGEVNIVFLCNPFDGTTFRLWSDRLLESIEREPRIVRLAYVNPVEHDHLLQTRRYRFVGQIRGLRPTDSWSRTLSTYFYEIRPDREAKVYENEVHTGDWQ